MCLRITIQQRAQRICTTNNNNCISFFSFVIIPQQYEQTSNNQKKYICSDDGKECNQSNTSKKTKFFFFCLLEIFENTKHNLVGLGVVGSQTKLGSHFPCTCTCTNMYTTARHARPNIIVANKQHSSFKRGVFINLISLTSHIIKKSYHEDDKDCSSINYPKDCLC